jgi:4-amino-4-deoxy-L-arabinose transferase-like glycosyltransferase
MAVTAGGERKGAPAAHSLASVVDFAIGSHARALGVLVLVTLLCILPGFFAIPPTDRDESRFAQATKQMIETGEFVDIRFQDEVRYKKPVGIYWLQVGAVKAGQALGIPQALTTIWLYRIPSLIGALAAVLLTYWAALAFVTRRAALFAALMMASCLLLSVEGRIAKTDAMLLATIVAAMGAMARLYLPEQQRLIDTRASWVLPGIFWTALAAGVLLKGPVIAMFVGLCMLALAIIDRSARWLIRLRPLVGVPWFALLVLPWFLAITHKSGDSFLAESVGRDLLSKLFSGQESHGAPPGLYVLLYWATFFPGAMLTLPAVPAIWAARREPGAKLLLAWVIPSWTVLEIVVTKLPHYVLPAYPAIAILLAGIVDAQMLSRKRWLVNSTIWWFLLPLIGGILGVFALFYIARTFSLLIWPVIGGSVVMGLLAWRLIEIDGPVHSLLRAVAASVLLVVALFGLVVPTLAPVFPSVALAKLMRDSGCRDPLAASAGYHEPSLVFLAGTGTRLTDGVGAADFLSGGACRFAFIELRQERAFAQRADALGLLYSQVSRIEAFNIGSGKSAVIAVFRSGGPR